MASWSTLLRFFPVFILLFTTTHAQYRDGDVRLVGGSYQWEGRVEVYMSGVWGTITDSDWTNEDARVVCRKLGHFRPGATATSKAYFGEGKGPVHLDFVRCSGSEYNLTDCETQNTGSRTSHSLDVGVKCQPADGSYINGDLRLVGGPFNWEGRVETFRNGTWGAISDSQWSTNDANVVCKQLKHSQESGAVIPCCSVYGVGSGAIIMLDVVCVGTESRIYSCTFMFNTDNTLSHQQDVQVQCQKGNEESERDVRLVGGSYSWEGRVEIFFTGSWTTVYRSQDYDDTRVVCQQLGYNSYDPNSGCCRRVGPGTGLISITSLRCSTLDHHLLDCGYYSYSGYSHSSDWGVACSIDEPELLDVRLGSGSSAGQLQIYLPGRWQPVANSFSNWIANNSEVVCRQLGYAPYFSRSSSYYSPGTYSVSLIYLGTTIVNNVMCDGDESRLTDCSYATDSFTSYSTIGVRCQTYSCTNEDIRLADGDIEEEGRLEVCDRNRWGTVCGNGWTNNATALVCKHLGFSEIVGESRSFTSEKFGKGTGPVFIDYINCTGSFWERCSHFTHHSGCSHDDDVGVQCQPAHCSDGQLRLTESVVEYYGRLEICSNERWKTFYRSQWIPENARIACIELGFRTYRSWIRSSYGNGGGPRHSKYFRCYGSEIRLSQCESFNETAPRSASYDVGIYCYTDYCTDGEVRLMEGNTAYDGRLEVCLNGRWGVLAAKEWTQTNSHIVCNALGYDTTDEAANQSIPMAPSKPLLYHSIVCSSRDLTLLECGFKRSSEYDYVNFNKHAVVKCREPTCEDGNLRLLGGASEEEGRLEVCFNKRWGTVDGDGWTHTDTQVACRQLGFPTSAVSYTKTERKRYRTSRSLPISMTLVGCYGTEDNITNCSYHEFKYSTSLSSTSTSMDISITCTSDIPEPSSPETVAKPSTVANASLSISVILAVAVIGLVAALIVMFVMNRKKKSAKRENSHRSHDDPGTTGRYSSPGIHFSSKNEAISLDDKMQAEDLPAESYEEVEAPNPLPIPPKPQPKRAQNKPRSAPQKTDSTRYSRGANSRQNVGPKPAAAHPQRPSQQSWNQQQRQQHPPPPRSDSPEAIYECPD